MKPVSRGELTEHAIIAFGYLNQMLLFEFLYP